MREEDPGPLGGPTRRRAVIRTALAGAGGLAASSLLPLVADEAYAAPADAGAGPVVTPNPIGTSIARSGLAAELLDFCTPPRTSTARPYAHLNFLYHAGDGSGFVYVCDGRGKIWRVDPAGNARLFLDVAKARAGALLFILSSGRSTTGLRSFAFHPDFARSGRRGFRRLYTATTETAASYRDDVPLFSGPYQVHSHCVVAEWSVDPADPARVKPGSRREILRVAVYKDDHNIDQLMFDPNTRPGQVGHGAMFVGVGDGGNVPGRPDPYNQAQDLGRALGKILRIDPLRQGSGEPYGIPADNPFVDRNGRLPEIWAYGLRHPLNMSFDSGGAGALIVTDIGQEHVEEVNLGAKGANYGWPEREGTFVTDRRDGTVLYAPPTDDTAKGFTFPVAHYDHHEGGPVGLAAITGGFVYRGTEITALAGHYLFGDIVSGRVFHVPVGNLRPGRQATIKELTLKRNGRRVTLKELAGVTTRADLRFGQDQAGEIYVMTKQDGAIRKLGPA